MVQYSIDCGGRFDENSTINGRRVESAESPCMKGYALDAASHGKHLTRPKND
jgi:hypothetical protein